MSSEEINKREVCPLHGWVGRRLFVQNRHDLCEAPEQPSFEDVDGSGDEENDEDLDEEDDEGDRENRELPLEGVSRQSTARRRGIPPKKTLAVRRITRSDLAAGRAELRALGADVPYDRPRTRGECAHVPRPCPYVACKYSLYLDVSETGSIILNFPHLEPGQMPAEQSCALDLSERGGMTLEDIAVVTNLTRERIRQVELKALIRRAHPVAMAMGLGPEGPSRQQPVDPEADLETDLETGVEEPLVGMPNAVGTGLTRSDADE